MAKDSAKVTDQAPIDPLVPHNTREEVDNSPPPPKKQEEPEVVEPMIPHNRR